jgi:hypothetical protein
MLASTSLWRRCLDSNCKTRGCYSYSFRMAIIDKGPDDLCYSVPRRGRESRAQCTGPMTRRHITLESNKGVLEASGQEADRLTNPLTNKTDNDPKVQHLPHNLRKIQIGQDRYTYYLTYRPVSKRRRISCNENEKFAVTRT